MTTIIGPGTQTPTANKFRSTNIYGNLFVQDNTSGTIPAFAGFQRDVVVGGNLILGMEESMHQEPLSILLQTFFLN